MRNSLLAALLLSVSSVIAPATAADLRIGLQEDPDVLDPDQSRTFVGRIVYASLCDKLVDITPDLEIIPQLATGWSWQIADVRLRPRLGRFPKHCRGAAIFRAQIMISACWSFTRRIFRRRT